MNEQHYSSVEVPKQSKNPKKPGNADEDFNSNPLPSRGDIRAAMSLSKVRQDGSRGTQPDYGIRRKKRRAKNAVAKQARKRNR